MNLHRLRCFLAVADEANFGRAADRLGMAQPPLTRQIKTLEAELGMQLFHRSRKGTTMTRSGEYLYPRARRLVRDADLIEAQMQGLVEGSIGPLRLGFVDSAAYSAMPSLIQSYRQRWPDVTLELSNLTSDEQVDALEAGAIDVGLVRATPRSAALRRATVHRESLRLAVHADSALARRSQMRLRDLTTEPLVGFSMARSPSLHAEVAAIFARAGANYNPHQEARTYTTVLGLVAAGSGVAVVPESVANSALDSIRFIEIADRHATTSMILVCRPGEQAPTVTRAFDIIEPRGGPDGQVEALR